MNSWTWITPSWSESAAWNKAWAFFVPTPICLKTSRRGTCFFGQKHEACTTTTPKEKGYPFFGSPNKKWNQKTSYSRDFDLQLKVDADLQSSVTITKWCVYASKCFIHFSPFLFLVTTYMPYMQRRPRLHVSTTFFATSASLLDVSWSKIPSLLILCSFTFQPVPHHCPTGKRKQSEMTISSSIIF